jgi:superfamily II DNA/RNA helicase
MIASLARHTAITAALVVGGLPLARQAAELRAAPDVVVATPGRIIDHVLNTMSFDLGGLAVLVLDEADRLLDLGFAAEARSSRHDAFVFAHSHTNQTVYLVHLKTRVSMGCNRGA